MWGYLLVAEETFQSKIGEQLLLTDGGGEAINGLTLFFKMCVSVETIYNFMLAISL